MTARLLEITQQIIRAALAGERVDKALREGLAYHRRLTVDEKTTIAQGIFTYFRWVGWITPDPMKDPEKASGFVEIRRTAELAARFSAKPGSFADDELLAHWAPAWVAEVMPVSASLVRAFQAPPLLWLRAKPGEREMLAGSLQDVEIAPKGFPDALAYTGPDDLFRHPLFHQGAFEIQDLASQAVGIMCDPQEKETWWDACAGEGGKTMHLAQLKKNKGLIWASDTAQWRLDNLKRRAARGGVFNYRMASWKGDANLPTKTKFDGILVDAPCSGMGTWGRNPQARWTTTAKDVQELAALQKQLLTHAVKGLKPGGRLIYSVCTLARPECDEVVESISAAQPQLRPLELTAPFSGARSATHSITPLQTRSNAMFVAGWHLPS
ncbi:MAG TPA: RsmB/NOP family class I SAM-dependent RNA methyltransferase [Methylomirabilota bacterium]|nr:RsmB/NOP family class I SAM-dependent RNA methyltransferase [Methylomirabilota bacterium]